MATLEYSMLGGIQHRSVLVKALMMLPDDVLLRIFVHMHASTLAAVRTVRP